MLKPLKPIDGAAEVSGYVMRKPMPLEPWLYLAVLALFALDVLIVVLMSSGWSFGRRAPQAAAMLLAVGLLTVPHGPADAQTQAPTQQGSAPAANSDDDFALKASLKTHLAYVMTGDPQIDEVSRQGLAGLSKVLTARTALEPAEPMGVDIDKDELAFFPVLYWPVREDAEPLSDATLAKVDAFMKQGGFIIFDTRDQDTAMPGADTAEQGVEQADRPARRSAARAGAGKPRAHQVFLSDARAFPAAGTAARSGSKPSRRTRPTAASARAAPTG